MSFEFNIVENDSKSFETAMDKEMANPIRHFELELTKIRTGKANTAMIEDSKVSCYGQAPMALKGLAILGAPDAKLLTIQPWDTSIIGEIEKSIQTSNLNVSSQNDGEIIRVKIPPMSATRRADLVKVLNQKLEESKVAIRNVRKELQNEIRDAEKGKKLSEDFSKRLQDVLQKSTDKFIKLSDQMSSTKETEIKNL